MATHKGRQNVGVDVCLEYHEKAAPHCPHGPTLLFERYSKDGSTVEQYFACSACRDRKDCNFFQRKDEKVSQARQNARDDFNKSQQPAHSHKYYHHRLKGIKKLSESDRKFCMTCSLVLLKEEWVNHNGHNIVCPISDQQLKTPSMLLTPLENKKLNAQYLFSKNAATFIMKTIQQLGYRNVLCIGAPRIHEEIQAPFKSLLLDIDHRYEQFYTPDEFLRYNMFNHHFFDGQKSEDTFIRFMANDKIILVTDPPFGGLVEVLAATVKKISSAWQSIKADRLSTQLPVLWFFPYFLEPKILESLPDFNMLDYKVDYDNHPLYQQGDKGRKLGSPVRLFTNIHQSQIKLPAKEGYRFCQPCQRYSAAENVHCKKCGKCPSKDGQTYRHCDECQRCVKPSRIHCNTCGQCLLPNHTCGQLKKSQGCHICGDFDHKRRNCPKKSNSTRKRKMETLSPSLQKSNTKKAIKDNLSSEKRQFLKLGRKKSGKGEFALKKKK